MPTAPCPYCGNTPPADATRCDACGGLFEPLSRTATQLAMGPWQVRDDAKPFMPGFSTAVLVRQVASGRVKADTVLRGPSTYQFWMRADQTPGVSRLLGKCHACRTDVDPAATACGKCNADLSLPDEADTLGLMYVTDAERAAAQKQVNAGRGAPPPSKTAAAPAAKKPKPSPHAGVDLEADALKPIDKPSARPSPSASPKAEALGEDDLVDDAPASNAADPIDHDHDPEPHDAIDDLWAAADDAASTRRKRARRANPNGAVIAMLGVTLVIMIIGVVVVIGRGGGETDPTDGPRTPGSGSASNPDGPARPQITAAAVDGARGDFTARFEELDRAQIPEPLRSRYDLIQKQLDDAEQARAAERFQEAFDRYVLAGKSLTELIELRDKYLAEAEQREAAQRAQAAMVKAKLAAEAADAQRYAGPDWTRGTDREALAGQQLAAAEFDAARDNFADAAQAYEDAGLLAERGIAADQAREKLIALMKTSAPRPLLEEHAGDELKQVMDLQQQAVDQMNQREYAQAGRLYDQATETLARCNELVEQARGRKYYAYLAGYAAADALLTLAAGEPLPNNVAANLGQVMAPLNLPDPIKNNLPRTDASDYAAAANVLINQLREHLSATYGQEVQLSYAIGVKARIIEKALSFDQLTADQRSTVGTGVRELQDLALQAQWDPATLAPALDAFRDAVRQDQVGQKATAAPAAWANVLKLLSTRETGLPLMTPDHIEDAEHPELFPE